MFDVRRLFEGFEMKVTSFKSAFGKAGYKTTGRYQTDKEQSIRLQFETADRTPSDQLYAECDRLIARGVAEIQSTWTEAGFERRAAWAASREVTMPQIEIHRICDNVLSFRAVG